MDIVQIKIDRITDVGRDCKCRTIDPNMLPRLADSIRVQGLINPISVRPSPEDSEKYELITGQHRLLACRDYLGWTEIPCTVVRGIPDKDAQLTSYAENMIRAPLNIAQRSRAVSALSELFTLDDGKTLRPKEKKEIKRKIADKLGVKSQRQINRLARIAEKLDEEDLDGLDSVGASQRDIETIANIENKSDRKQAAKYLVMGLSVDKAIERTVAPKEEVPEIDDILEDFGIANSDELSEDNEVSEWVETSCSNIKSLLSDTSKYEVEAKLYRAVNSERLKFRSEIRKKMASIKDEMRGPLYWLLTRIMDLSHPKDWVLCPDCHGKASTTGEYCGRCSDSGYTLKTEKYQ